MVETASKIKSLCVIGAGNAGHAIAFVLTKKGYCVCLYNTPSHSSKIEAIKGKGLIIKKTQRDQPGEEDIKIDLATTDTQVAANYSSILILALPAYAQAEVFCLLLPYLTAQHMVVNLPGNGGGLAMAKILREQSRYSLISEGFTIVDGNSTPFACRLQEPGMLLLSGVKLGLDIATFPGDRIEAVLPIIQEILAPTKLYPLSNVFMTLLEQINFMHVPMVALNIGFIEHDYVHEGKNIKFYQYGCSKPVAKVIDAIDRERNAIAGVFGQSAKKL